MRKGRNALAALAQEVMKVDPFGGALFVYIGRRFNALKLIYCRSSNLSNPLCDPRRDRPVWTSASMFLLSYTEDREMSWA
jgi:hypothetical protein